jgi:hypothetical protein
MGGNTMGFFNEAYYGKNMKLLKLESLCEQLGNKMRADGGYDPNFSKELKEMELILTKMFNFEKIHFVVDGDTVHMNAFTIPFFFADKFEKRLLDVEEGKDGIRYVYPDDKVLVLNQNAYNFVNLTPSQNVAIILHEIGHNFFLQTQNIKKYEARNTMIDFFDKLLHVKTKYHAMNPLMVIFILQLIIQLIARLVVTAQIQSDPKEFLKQVAEQIRSQYKIKKKHGEETLDSRVEAFTSTGFFKIIKKPFHVFLAPAILYMKEWELKGDKRNGYDNEKFADNFATSYGYGKEVAEVFAKGLSKFESKVRQTEYGIQVMESTLFTNAFVYFADPHPSRTFRVEWAKKKLVHELENNRKYLTPKQIADIKKQIKVIDDLINDKDNVYLNVNRELNKRFNYDDRKDKAGSKFSDRDIMDFENGILKEFFKKSGSQKKSKGA